MKSQTSIYLLLLIVWAISSCQPIEDIIDDPTNTGSQSISAKIDGEEFSVSGILITAEYSEINEMVQSLSIVGAKLPLNGVTEGVVFAVVSTDSSGINAGDTYTETSISKAGAGEYFFENSSLKIKALSKNTEVATITITEIDYSKKIVSGTFSFDAYDEDDPGKIYEIRDGEFKDVSFD